MSSNGLSFQLVEKFRKDNLHISSEQMAELLGVTRMTYYRWKTGGPIRRTRGQHASALVASLVEVVRSGQWTSDEAKSYPREERLTKLKELLERTSASD